MDKDSLEKMLRAGVSRFFAEGHKRWSKADVIGAINPQGEKHYLNDPAVQSILKTLEAEGIIKIIARDDFYFEVLRQSQ
mgnify:CR=1 FL=1